MWQLAMMWAPSSTTTPGPKNTLGSTITSRPITVSKLSHTVSGATSVAPCSMTRAPGTPLEDGLGGRQLLARVDAQRLLGGAARPVA